MTTDYFPRLAGQIGRGEAVGEAIAEQMELALLLALPMLLGVAATAPLLLHLLYSAEFVGAGPLLRLQTLGDAFKLLTVPLSFALLAAGRGKTFVVVEVLTCLMLVGTATLLIPRLGLEGAGVAYVLTLATYFVTMLLLVRGLLAFRWTRPLLLTGGSGLAMLAITIPAAMASPIAGGVIGLPFAAFAGYRVLRRLSDNGMLPFLRRP
jgi:PST family polysaccharide transporter